MPTAPTAKGSVDDELAKQKAEREKSLAEAKKNLEKMPANLRSQMEATIKQMEEQFKAMDKDAQMQAITRQSIEMSRAEDQKNYQERLKAHDKAFPADPNVLIARRLREFLATSQDVDFGAKLVANGSQRRFADARYEDKSRDWKLWLSGGQGRNGRGAGRGASLAQRPRREITWTNSITINRLAIHFHHGGPVATRRIGILTGGGDVPGLNVAIKAVAVRARNHGIEVVGLRRGWLSVLQYNPDDPECDSKWLVPLTPEIVRTFDRTGGTLLHSSRTNPSKVKPEDVPAHVRAEDRVVRPDGRIDCTKHALRVLEHLQFEALVPIGGDDTLSFASRLHSENFRVVAIPKTMDNDVFGTDYCIGFSTAVTRSVDAITNFRTSVGSHERIGVVELFGRNSGRDVTVRRVPGGRRPRVDFGSAVRDRQGCRFPGRRPEAQSVELRDPDGVRGCAPQGRRHHRIGRGRCLRPQEAGRRPATW